MHLFTRLSWWKKGLIGLVGLAGVIGGGVAILVVYSQSQSNSAPYIRRWFDDRANRPDLMTVQRTPCPGAPFLLPSGGLIGLLWRDSAVPYNILRRHTGIDIFGDGEPGGVPVYAAYDGYLTRRPDWKSSVIIRHDDPLQPGRTIWTYYTHMAARDGTQSFIADDFPPGTSDVWVKQGTRLGYQGEYSGDSLFPVGLHVHFSIVTSDPDGSFKNESHLGNTLDPSPYLGMALNIKTRPSRPIRCTNPPSSP
jgi:murein DD-endopeptidase MepM/ murein hydrolase activator NlpD